mgnify:CR=1 FL=1
MKRHIGSRLGLAHVHDVLQQVCDGIRTIEQGCASVGVVKTRHHELPASYLRPSALGEVGKVVAWPYVWQACRAMRLTRGERPEGRYLPEVPLYVCGQ